jgi:hypothetical protein
MDFASYSTAFAFLAQRGSVFDVQAQEQPPCSGGVYTLLSSDQPGHPQIAATILPNFKTPFFRIYDPSSRSNVRVRWSIGGLVY